MPRPARLFLPGMPMHLIQRGHNRRRCFFADSDFLQYLNCLRGHAGLGACQIHSYVLMSNHVHLLVSAPDIHALASMMKNLGQRYTQYFNRKYQCSGSLWEGRYKSCLVQAETYLMACQRYLELNPVRAGMVSFPGHYRWSSYRGNAEGRHDCLLTPHSIYQRLGCNALERQNVYRGLFMEHLAPATIERIRVAGNLGLPLGEALQPRMPE